MSITFRALKPGEEKEVIAIIEKGYGVESLPHFRWKLMENPSWKYEYSVIGEIEGRIAAVAFLELQTITFLDKTLEVMVGGSGTVPEEFRRRGYYKKLAVSAADRTNRLGKTMFMVFVDENWFTCSALKKLGFYNIFSSEMRVKILSVRRAFTIAAEKLNNTTIDRNLSLTIRIVPDSEKPFVLQLRGGKFSIKENVAEYDLAISGDLKKMVVFFIGNTKRKIVPLLLKREIKVKVRMSSVKKIMNLAKILW